MSNINDINNNPDVSKQVVLKPKLFGTSGIRGYAENLDNEKRTDFSHLTDNFCFAITKSFLLFIEKKYGKKGKIAVGIDKRSSSPRILNAVAKAINHEGFEISYQGITPSPALTYFVKESGCIGGIMITGSHIPPNLNGLKFINDSEEILKNEEKEIENIYFSLISPENSGNFLSSAKKMGNPALNFKEEQAANQLYYGLLKSYLKINFSGLKIIVDTRYSCQSKIIPGLLRECGAEVIEIPFIKGENFCNVDNESTKNPEPLTEYVLKNNADLGIIYDGDGDRPFFVQKNGRIIVPDALCSIVAKGLDINTLIVPITVSNVVDTLGKKVVRTKVGSPYVVEEMKNQGASGRKCFGFEANGGAIYPESIMTRDAGITTIIILNRMKLESKSLQELKDELPVFHQKRDKFDCPTQCNDKIIAFACEKYKIHPNISKIIDLDGIKFVFNDNSSLLFRASQNAPEFRVFSEALTYEHAENLASEGLLFAKQKMEEFSKGMNK